jgi:metal-sulfur cluster biosynthetic enzyme
MSEVCALVSEDVVLDCLNSIGDPCSAAHGQAMGIVDMGLIERLVIDPAGRVEVRLRLTSPCCGMVGYFIEEAKARVGALAGVAEVAVDADHGLDWSPAMMSEEAQRRRRARLRGLGIAI